MMKLNYFNRAFILSIIGIFLTTTFLPPVFAQSVLNLPQAGTMVKLSEAFQPSVLVGMKIFPDNPLKFDFILDEADSGLEGDALKEESTKLIKYFLASLTIPEKDLWVNLSPQEKDRIVPGEFGVTEMGRDLLAQDYMLKQITASLMYPEGEVGKKFWERVYEEVQKKYGQEVDIPVDTFNKVWILPDKASVYENGDVVMVVDSHLKVMLEKDYLSSQSAGSAPEHSIQEDILREILIPIIEKEVNEGRNFASLRQIYNSLILATWYKRNLKESLLGKIYVGKEKVEGVDVEDREIKEKIYHQYLDAFKKGTYDYIKEEYDASTQQVIQKKYFSGGAELTKVSVTDVNSNAAMLAFNGKKLDFLSILFNPWRIEVSSSSLKDKTPAEIINILQSQVDKLLSSEALERKGSKAVLVAQDLGLPMHGTGENLLILLESLLDVSDNSKRQRAKEEILQKIQNERIVERLQEEGVVLAKQLPDVLDWIGLNLTRLELMPKRQKQRTEALVAYSPDSLEILLNATGMHLRSNSSHDNGSDIVHIEQFLQSEVKDNLDYPKAKAIINSLLIQYADEQFLSMMNRLNRNVPGFRDMLRRIFTQFQDLKVMQDSFKLKSLVILDFLSRMAKFNPEMTLAEVMQGDTERSKIFVKQELELIRQDEGDVKFQAYISDLNRQLAYLVQFAFEGASQGDDAASMAESPNEVGGIDLNPTGLDIKSHGNKVKFTTPPDLKYLETTPINGFTPVIYQMTPVTNIPLLLGIKEENDSLYAGS